MISKAYKSELAFALARPDIEELKRVVDAYRNWDASVSDDYPDACDRFMDSYHAEPEVGIAFVMIAAAEYDDVQFLGLVAAGLLENLLCDGSTEITQRILVEARKSARLRWMLSGVWYDSVPPETAAAAQKLIGSMMQGDVLPPRPEA